MSKRVRQIIFLVVFTLSVLGLVAILAYGVGYSFDFETGRFRPTGSIRLTVDPKDDVLIQLLPTGASSNSNQASFTHLLPGTYHLYVEAPGYQSANFVLAVEPNATLIIEPLRLWAIQKPQRLFVDMLAPVVVEMEELSIALQSAVSQMGIAEADAKLLPIDQRTIVVLNRLTKAVHLLTQNGNVIQTRSLGTADDIQATYHADEVLLITQFSLERANLYTNSSETIIRLSKPIDSATWIIGTPYIAYSVEETIHIIDSRPYTNYSDQVVAENITGITDLRYDAELDELRWVSGQLPYKLPLRLAK